MGLSKKEYWSGLPCPPPGVLPNPENEPRSPTLQADCWPSEPPGKPLALHKHGKPELTGTFCSSKSKLGRSENLQLGRSSSILELLLLTSPDGVWPVIPAFTSCPWVMLMQNPYQIHPLSYPPVEAVSTLCKESTSMGWKVRGPLLVSMLPREQCSRSDPMTEALPCASDQAHSEMPWPDFWNENSLRARINDGQGGRLKRYLSKEWFRQTLGCWAKQVVCCSFYSWGNSAGPKRWLYASWSWTSGM